MSYTKHDFKAGDVLYASQLNEMEESIEENLGQLSTDLAEVRENMDNALAETQAATYRSNEGNKRITDALKARMQNFRAFGQSDQDPVSGSEYQCIPFSPGSTFTNAGVTVTVDENQRLSVSGTATRNITVAVSDIPFTVEAGANYTLSANRSTYTWQMNNDGRWPGLYANDYSLTETRLTLQNEKVLGVYLLLQNGTTYDDTGIELMLEPGTARHDWEPYSGGVLAPTPETPFEPTSVTEIHIAISDGSGEVVQSATVVPPRPLYGMNGYGDVCDPAHGVWRYVIRKRRLSSDLFSDWELNPLTNSHAYSIANSAIHRIQPESGSSGAMLDKVQILRSHWGNDKPYIGTAENSNIQIRLPLDSTPTWFDDNDVYLYYPCTEEETVEMDAATKNALLALSTCMGETRLSVTDQNGNDLKALFLYQLNLSSVIESMGVSVGYDFSQMHFATDGDSTTTEGSTGEGFSWPHYMNEKLNFASKTNVAAGNAETRDRVSSTSGTSYTCQWKPDVGDAWVDYYGLNDPNFAGNRESVYQSGTAAYDQARANNCLYSHIGYYIDGVDQKLFPVPDVFVLAMQGVNDLWGKDAESASAVIGTVEEALSGSWQELTRDTVLKAIRWAVQRLRQEYPACRLFYKTAPQKTSVSHPGYPLLEDRILALCRALSVPVIDSYGELGVQSEFESGASAAENQWSSDGVHPTADGYRKDGYFTAAKLKTFFI